MADNALSTDQESPYTKKDAASYLGIKMRTLEYAMHHQTITFEKHGRKVVFRKAHLDSYREKLEIRSKDHPISRTPTQASEAENRLPSARPRLMHGMDARDLICELTASANESRRLTKDTARVILAKLGTEPENQVDAFLAEYEASALAAYQQLGNPAPLRAVGRMDWSFAIAPCYLDFLGRYDHWQRCGSKVDVPIHLRTPFDPIITYPERMLPGLQTIPEEAFSDTLEQIGRMLDRQFPNDLVPFEIALRRSMDSLNRKPRSLAGPMAEDDLRNVLIRNFSAIDAQNILFNRVISIPALAKIRWLTS